MNAQQRNNIPPDTHTLAEPFSQIFVDRAEANWAFDLLLDTVKRLGLKKPNDERFALTFPRQSGKLCLHLNFGQWLVLGFCGPGGSGELPLMAPRVEMALLADQVSWNERFTTLPSERKQGEPEVRSYHLPIETVRPLTSDLQTAYETTLDFIAGKFHAWKRSPYWKSHNPEIIEALFDLNKREQIFAGLFTESELRYERHYTAFHEIAEEEVGYETTEILEDTIIQGMPMKIITVDALDGIKEEFQTDLFEAMRECNNQERIMVCLYFLSDLPYDQQNLERIEKTLRKIFPPSLGEGYKPENYVDFQAMVRGYLGDEYRKVKRGSLTPENSLWETRGRGYWRNTTPGNQRAIEILEKQGLQVVVTKEDESEENFTIDQPQINPLYSLPQLSADTGFDETELAHWVRAIERKGQIVLYGPPGTGKTFIAEKLAQHLIGGGDGFAELVQFHPAYAYEDFIQGLRPQVRPDGGLDYPLVPGRFLEFCCTAKTRQDRCVLIIDEINRANLARVFGELMYLLEYRNQEIPLAGGGTLQIPANVRLIGTMNTADRSIALVDHALRRRFAFIQLAPNFEVLRRYHRQRQTGFPVGNLITTLAQLNQQIGDAHYFVGITFFLHENVADEIEDIWQMEIEPYLEEYFFDQPDKVEDFRWTTIKKKVLG